VAAGALRNFKTAATRKEQLRLNALALGLRLGAHDLLPDHVIVREAVEPAGGIDAYLGQVLGRPVHVSLYISPARAVRKPVLQVLDERGATIGFAKVGVDAFTAGLVRAEAAAVRRAGAATRRLRVPDVLHAGAWNGHEVLVQSALPRGSAVTATTPEVGDAAREVAHIDGGPAAAALAASSYWRRLSDRVAALPAGAIPDRLRAALKEIEQVHGATTLTFGASHGDFAPWNMTLLDGYVLVWDWEKFESDVPVGFDTVHCQVQGDVVLGGSSPVAAFAAGAQQAQSLLAPVGNRGAAGLVVWLYAVDIATRYLIDREEEAGRTRMTTLADWLPDVLDRAFAEAWS
jgi:hypothetical protein